MECENYESRSGGASMLVLITLTMMEDANEFVIDCSPDSVAADGKQTK